MVFSNKMGKGRSNDIVVLRRMGSVEEVHGRIKEKD